MVPMFEHLPSVHDRLDIERLFSLFVESKISKNIRSCFSSQACSNQFYIFIGCKLCIFSFAIRTIRHYSSPFFLFIRLLKMLLNRPTTVTVVVFIILVLRYNGTIASTDSSKLVIYPRYSSPALLRKVASGSEGFCILMDFMPSSSFVRSLRFSFSTTVYSDRHLTNKSYSVELL